MQAIAREAPQPSRASVCRRFIPPVKKEKNVAHWKIHSDDPRVEVP